MPRRKANNAGTIPKSNKNRLVIGLKKTGKRVFTVLLFIIALLLMIINIEGLRIWLAGLFNTTAEQVKSTASDVLLAVGGIALVMLAIGVTGFPIAAVIIGGVGALMILTPALSWMNIGSK